MAYVIQCHIVDDDEQIRCSVSFYGATEEEAQEAYDEYFEKMKPLVDAEARGSLVEDEGDIDDQDRPELEEEEEDLETARRPRS